MAARHPLRDFGKSHILIFGVTSRTRETLTGFNKISARADKAGVDRIIPHYPRRIVSYGNI